tara:strand:- start:3505 stop:4041 length:537 start_codon:yes stop_codon:yes gene_type:complete
MQAQELEFIVINFVKYLKRNNITPDTNLKAIKQIRIVGEIEKLIQQNTELKKKLSDADVSEKIGMIADVVKHVLDDKRVRKHLNDGQVNLIKKTLEDSETLETIVDMIEFIYDGSKDKVLEGLDKNNDGKVTTDEVQESCTCCGNKKMAKCWSNLFIKFICCGKNNSVKYENKEVVDI